MLSSGSPQMKTALGEIWGLSRVTWTLLLIYTEETSNSYLPGLTRSCFFLKIWLNWSFKISWSLTCSNNSSVLQAANQICCLEMQRSLNSAVLIKNDTSSQPHSVSVSVCLCMHARSLCYTRLRRLLSKDSLEAVKGLICSLGWCTECKCVCCVCVCVCVCV